MDMIKKISLTASIMLFVLAQLFSFYVIQISLKEKTELLEHEEEKMLLRYLQSFEKDVSELDYEDIITDQIIVYFFRKNTPENTALYKGNRQLCNRSSYDFDAESLTGDENIIYCKNEKVKGKYLLVLYEKISIGKQKYTACYVVDATNIILSGINLWIKEIIISFILSGITAFLLMRLIKRITMPLKAANEAQLLLIGSMSHELKTPLTAIKGYSETLLSVRLSKEQARKSLEYIYSETGRLSRLTEKMMELTKLYEPDCRIEFRLVSIEKLFDAVQKNVCQSLEERQLELVWEGNYKGIEKNLDYDLMVSFLINLINNSMMASKPQSRIFIGADKSSIWVRDEGCGIPQKEFDKVCKAFYRVDKSRSRKNGNMGLGLALCEQIAKVHGGKILIESKEGEGTKISLYKSFTTN